QPQPTLFPYTTLFRSKSRSKKKKTGALIEDERCDELFRRTVDDPEQLASVGIVTRDALAAGENHLGAIRDGADHWNAVAARLVRDRKSTRLNSSHLGI